jgi:hypothetical protein
MSPPTEQLIRDYLNRLSVAARGQLGPDDRRALVSRTRDLIERKTSFAGPPTAMGVARLLAGLGDPSRLVEQERQRLAAVRAELPAPAAARSRFSRVLRRDTGRARTASWHWPVPDGSRAERLVTLLDSEQTQTHGQDDRGAPASPSVPPDAGAVPGTSGSNGVHGNGVAREDMSNGADEQAAHGPAQGSEPSWLLRELGGSEPDANDQADELRAVSAGAPDEPAATDQGKPRWPLVVARSGTGASQEQIAGPDSNPGEAQPTGAGPAWQLTTRADPVVSREVRRAIRAVTAWYRRMPLEASAVVLLGLGGAIYPPVWLLGAAIALASRLWDYKDKWVGLAVPVVLTLIGIAVGITSGGHVSVSHSVHEGWVYGVATSRIAAVLSACYLGWRSLHGRRPPTVAPWNRPHDTG